MGCGAKEVRKVPESGRLIYVGFGAKGDKKSQSHVEVDPFSAKEDQILPESGFLV